MKKSTSYTVGLLSIVFLTVLSIIIDKNNVELIVPSSIAGIVGLTLAYIGGNVADNGVKGKFFNENLVGK